MKKTLSKGEKRRPLLHANQRAGRHRLRGGGGPDQDRFLDRDGGKKGAKASKKKKREMLIWSKGERVLELVRGKKGRAVARRLYAQRGKAIG